MKASDYVVKYGDRIKGTGVREELAKLKAYQDEIVEVQNKRLNQETEHVNHQTELNEARDKVEKLNEKIQSMKGTGAPSKILHPIAYKKYMTDLQFFEEMLESEQKYCEAIDSYMQTSQAYLDKMNAHIEESVDKAAESRDKLKALDDDSLAAISEMVQEMLLECLDIAESRKTSTYKGLIGAIKDVNNVWNAVRLQLPNIHGDYILVKDGFSILAEEQFNIPSHMRQHNKK